MIKDDKINRAIIAILRENSRIGWQELGRKVHLSGQAAAERVQKLQEAGIISGFGIRQNALPRHFISVIMAHNRFDEFEAWLMLDSNVESVDKTSGDCCYQIVYIAESAQMLEAFLAKLLVYGRYRVATVLKRIK